MNGPGLGDADAAPVVRLRQVAKTYRSGTVEVAALKGISLDIPRNRFSMVSDRRAAARRRCSTSSAASTRRAAAPRGVRPDGRRAQRQRAHGFPRPQHRLHLPELQPHPGALGLRERRVPAAAGRDMPRRAARARRSACSKPSALPSSATSGRTSSAAARSSASPSPARWCKHPEIVLADEPTANLDSQTGAAIIELMHRVQAERHHLHLLHARSAAHLACRRDLHHPRRRTGRAMTQGGRQ